MLASRTRISSVLTALVLSAGTLAAQTASFAVAPSVGPKVSVITRQIPNIVTNGTATRVAEKATSDRLELVLNLPLRNEDKLDQLLVDLYNPQSPLFHKYITPQEFDLRFGPTAEDYKSLISWANAKGLHVNYTVSNNRLLQVDGPVELINSVFHVTETNYHDTFLDRDFYAPDREPTTDLSFPLLEVDGLDNAAPKRTHLTKGPNAGPISPTPLPAYISAAPIKAQATGGTKTPLAGSGADGYFLPSDMRAAYYGGTDLTGAGQIVGVYSYDGYNTSDVTGFYNASGTTQTVAVTNVLVGGYKGTCFGENGTSGTCDDGEQVLDIVNVIGMAPGLSSVRFYESTNANTELNAMATEPTATRPSVISCSWQGGTFGTASDTYFKQFGTQGQTYLTASGDSGGFNSSTYGAPGLDPYVVVVGGTDMTTTGPGGSYVSETAWVDGGGGFLASAGYTLPTWQATNGVITTANKGSTTYRNSPDVSAEANFDNLTYDNGAYEGGYGGTSFATPRYAGYLALVNQQAATNGAAAVGFVNPTLYTLGLGTSASTVYHDVTVGSDQSSAGTSTSYPAVTGYDDATGWGSPDGAGLINALAGAGFSIAPGTATVNVTRNGTANETFNVTAYNGFSQSVTFTATGLPSGVTAAFTTGTSTTPSTMTLTSSNTAIGGTYTITVTGSYNGITHTTTFVLNSLKRAGGDFTISGTNASLTAGSGGSSTITVAPGSGLVGPLSLVVSGIPAGVTAVLSTNSTYSTATLTYTTILGTAYGSYPITVTGTALTGLLHTATFTLTITAPPSVLLNGGFEMVTGTSPVVATYWTTGTLDICTTAACGLGPHSGTYFLYLDAKSAAAQTETATQSVAIPAGKTKATLGFYFAAYTNETSTTKVIDTFTASIVNSAGTATTLATFSNLNATGVYNFYSYDVSAFIGQTVTVKFTGAQTTTILTAFLVDDAELVVQ